MDINALDIVIHIINIFVLFIILRLLVYKPVSKFLNGRKERVARQLADAEQAQAQALELKAEYVQKLAGSEKEANEKMVRILSEANDEAVRITETARADAERLAEDTHKKAQADAAAVMSGLKDEIKDMSIKIASKILEREVSEADNRVLVENIFNEENRQ